MFAPQNGSDEVANRVSNDEPTEKSNGVNKSESPNVACTDNPNDSNKMDPETKTELTNDKQNMLVNPAPEELSMFDKKLECKGEISSDEFTNENANCTDLESSRDTEITINSTPNENSTECKNLEQNVSTCDSINSFNGVSSSDIIDIGEIKCNIDDISENKRIRILIKKTDEFECANCNCPIAINGSLRLGNSPNKDKMRFLCSKCSKHENNPKKKMKEKVPPKVYPCAACNSVFSKKCNWKRHMEVIHKNDLKFACNECSLEFSERAFLDNHVDRAHKVVIVKTYKCRECNQHFPRKTDLKVHVAVIHRNITNLTFG